MRLITRRAGLLAPGILFLLSGCSSRSPTTTTPTAVRLDVSSPDAFVLLVAIEQMSATVQLSNGTVQRPAGVWTSDAPAVAVVGPSGTVSAVGAGQATITFDDGTRRAMKTLRVVPDYGHRWAGTFVQTECQVEGDLVLRDYATAICRGSGVPNVNPSFAFDLVQQQDIVSGSESGGSFAGVIAVNGTLTLNGDSSVEIGGVQFQGHTTWILQTPQPGALTGSFETTISAGRSDGTAYSGSVRRAGTIAR